MKVLHLASDVGGNAWGLSQAEKKLGITSEVLYKSASHFGYSADHQLNVSSYKPLQMLQLLKAFFRIRKSYDIFHFNFGSSLIHYPSISLLNQFELPFYPKEAKLFVTYNGCDARQKYPTMKRAKIAACHEKQCYSGMCNSGKLDMLRRRGIAKMTKHVSHIWALNPDLLYFLPKEKASFLPYSVSAKQGPVSLPNIHKKLTIIHAPTNRVTKGSRYVIQAIEELNKRYPDAFEFILVENLPHQQALQAFHKADLIIDQLLIGWYGAFAIESMLMGKPVITRVAKECLPFIPEKMASDLEQAIINANPFTIKKQIEACLLNPSLLLKKAEASLHYAKTWHSPEYVATLTYNSYQQAR